MLQYRNFKNASAVETRDHFKNGASLKSQTSRDFFKINTMKNLIYSMITVCVLFFSQGANAQITLEKTFDENVLYPGYISPFIGFYASANTATNQVKLYNEDYSLYTTVTITPPTGYKFKSTALFSKNIFTNDNKITFFVCFDSGNYDNLSEHLRLYDENGTMLKDFGYAYLLSPSVHVTSDNKYRLRVERWNVPAPVTYTTEIYSLPGTVTTGLRSAQVENPKQLPYPNPANTVITLPYKLEQGETSVMRIYDMGGRLVDMKQIDYMFDKILLNVAGYAKGVYIYEVNGVSNRFIVE